MRVAFISFLVILMSAEAALADEGAPITYTFGETVVGTPGETDEPVVYRFEGVSGTEVNFRLLADGEIGLTLYTPEGATMLQVDGSDQVDLKAYLPQPEAYYLAVHRASADTEYVLTGNTIDPDPHFAVFSYGVGYFGCWVEPGQILRRHWKNGSEEVTLGRDGWEFAHINYNDGRQTSARRHVSFENDQIVFQDFIGGKEIKNARDIRAYLVREEDDYQSYLCTD